jgi:multiple sugar transport system permease protein
MIAPALLFAAALSVVFLSEAAWTITHESYLLSASHPFIGLGHFAQIVTDALFVPSVVVTIVYVAVGITVETILGVGIALLMYYGIRGTRLARSIILIPLVTTPLVVGLVWRMMFDPSAGLVDFVLSSLHVGGQSAFLADPFWALPAVILVDVWEWTPFVAIIALAGLEAMDTEPLEAAAVDGASGLQTLRFVVLPLIGGTVAIAVLLRLVGLFQSFAVLYAMTEGGPGSATMVFNMHVYLEGFTLFRVGYATTLGLLYALVISFLLTPLARRVLGFTHEQ